MISYLTGTVTQVTQTSITLVVAGIGFDIIVPRPALYRADSMVSLSIFFHWNQDSGPQLYGFLNPSEKSLFSLVLSCAGCGPKIGLSVVASIEPVAFFGAIMQADSALLSSINGIGKKKAEQMILSLKDKVKERGEYDSFVQDSPVIAHLKKLDDVLLSLGYSRQETSSALESLKKQNVLESESFDQLLRRVLGSLSKKQ